jgi:hypothetical protein
MQSPNFNGCYHFILYQVLKYIIKGALMVKITIDTGNGGGPKYLIKQCRACKVLDVLDVITKVK